MFENLTERLNQTLKNLRGQGRLTEKNIKDSLREVRIALLEADVALPVVKKVMANIQARAIGQSVLLSLTPGQAFIKVVHDELVKIMGEACDNLNLQAQPPVVVLMAGLQGSGKTTTVAKLALWLKQRQKKKVLVVSTDVYRPAAIDQLKCLAEAIDVAFFPSEPNQNPITIAQNALHEAKIQFADVVIIDTAGRLHIDTAMMDEIKALHKAVNPTETLFVVDSMTGQDAVNTAKVFNDALPLTGVILTKADGDARGGAALSIRSVTGKPIKFIGVGEKTEALEPFHPDRMASRILGMGDILSLVEEAHHKIDKEKAEKVAKKIAKGGFDLDDFRSQLQQMRDMGGLGKLMEKLPGVSDIPAAVKNQFNDGVMIKFEAIINSMTPQERSFPQLLKGSRKRRIAQGSGTDVQDINRLLKQFEQMQKMVKKISKGGMKNMMNRMKHLLPKDGSLPF